jgi:hypothetical protein
MKDTTNLTKEVQYLPFIEKEKKKETKKKRWQCHGEYPKKSNPQGEKSNKTHLRWFRPYQAWGEIIFFSSFHSKKK